MSNMSINPASLSSLPLYQQGSSTSQSSDASASDPINSLINSYELILSPDAQQILQNSMQQQQQEIQASGQQLTQQQEQNLFQNSGVAQALQDLANGFGSTQDLSNALNTENQQLQQTLSGNSSSAQSSADTSNTSANNSTLLQVLQTLVKSGQSINDLYSMASANPLLNQYLGQASQNSPNLFSALAAGLNSNSGTSLTSELLGQPGSSSSNSSLVSLLTNPGNSSSSSSL